MPKAFSSEIQSIFDSRPGVLSRVECEAAAKNAALADKLNQLAALSVGNPGLARRLEELAGDYADRRQQIFHRATVSAVAQVQRNPEGQLGIRFTQTSRPGNPPVTVTQVSAYVVNPPRRGETAAGTETGASFSAKAGLSGLRQNAEAHARVTVTTPPSEVKVELANGWTGLLQRAAISLFGVQAGKVTQVFTPECRELAVASETDRLVNEVTARAASQISDETVQRVASDDYAQAAAAAAVQWDAAAAEVARDYGESGRYEGMSVLEASIASLQTTGYWKD